MKTPTCLALPALLLAVQATAQNVGIRLQSGTDGYMEIPNTPEMNPRSGITVEAWVTYDDTTLVPGWAWPTIVRQNIAAGQENYMLRVQAGQNSNTRLVFQARTANGNASAGWSFQSGQLLNTWTHVAGTYDGTMIRLFIDGTQVAATPQTGTMTSTGGVLRIGKGDDAIPGGETWNGDIDEVRLWPFARTAGEITSSKDLHIQSVPGLVSTWNFQNDFRDSSGSMNGTPVGTIPFVQNNLMLSLFPVSGGRSFGASTASCQGPIGATVSALPRIGNADFALICRDAPVNANGAVVTGFAALQSPLRVLGVDLWVDLSQGGLSVSLGSDGLGVSRVSLPVPNNAALAGASFYNQFFWIDTCGSQGLTASDGLHVFVLN